MSNVIPIAPKPDPGRRRRNIDAALREMEKVERIAPWLTEGRPPAGHVY